MQACSRELADGQILLLLWRAKEVGKVQNDQRLRSTDHFSQNKALQVCRLEIIEHHVEMQEVNAGTNSAGYTLWVLAGWRSLSAKPESCPTSPSWHNTAAGSILLLPMSLASGECCLEREPCHLMAFICKAFITVGLWLWFEPPVLLQSKHEIRTTT